MERAKGTFQEVISVEMDVQTPGSGGLRWAAGSKNFSIGESDCPTCTFFLVMVCHDDKRFNLV
jgi:hypothetical protein